MHGKRKWAQNLCGLSRIILDSRWFLTSICWETKSVKKLHQASAKMRLQIISSKDIVKLDC